MSALLDRIRREPVLVVTFIIAVLETEGFQSFTWVTPVIAVLGVIARFLVTPNPTVSDEVNTAFVDGALFLDNTIRTAIEKAEAADAAAVADEDNVTLLTPNDGDVE